MTRHPQATTQIRDADAFNDSVTTGRCISRVSIPALGLSPEFDVFSFQVGAGGCSPPQARETPPPDVHPPAEHRDRLGLAQPFAHLGNWSFTLCRFNFAPTGAIPKKAPVVAGPSVHGSPNSPNSPQRQIPTKVTMIKRAGRLYNVFIIS
jgi:hypothetical protein